MSVVSIIATSGERLLEHSGWDIGEAHDHIPDRYLHNVRYFGLLAPRVKSQTHDAVFALLGQKRLGKPSRLRWAASLQKSFGVDPLLDHDGRPMHWVRRVPPRPGSPSPHKIDPVAP